jgi:hypothetical protein
MLTTMTPSPASTTLDTKTIDNDGKHWCDWDDYCHGDPKSFIDDHEHADGFTWSCCEGSLETAGCKTRRHEALVH